jgi:hypothetical protein
MIINMFNYYLSFIIIIIINSYTIIITKNILYHIYLLTYHHINYCIAPFININIFSYPYIYFVIFIISLSYIIMFNLFINHNFIHNILNITFTLIYLSITYNYFKIILSIYTFIFYSY